MSEEGAPAPGGDTKRELVPGLAVLAVLGGIALALLVLFSNSL
jgi:hypothetical protein